MMRLPWRDGDEVAISDGAERARGVVCREGEGWFAAAWVQGRVRRLRVATTEGGYHCISWSKTYLGDGCARAYQPGPRSIGGSSLAAARGLGRYGAARRARRCG